MTIAVRPTFTQTQITTANFISTLHWHKITLLHAQITEKIKHESCSCNLRLRKSRPYGNCHILAGI
jgi:hypothetical protein